MPPMEEIEALKATWRTGAGIRTRFPETAFEEKATSAYVGMLLELFGVEIDRGFAGNGSRGDIEGKSDRPDNWPAGRQGCS